MHDTKFPDTLHLCSDSDCHSALRWSGIPKEALGTEIGSYRLGILALDAKQCWAHRLLNVPCHFCSVGKIQYSLASRLEI